MSVDLEELEKVLKLRAAFDYGTQPIEFLWGYDHTLIEAVPKLIALVRELEEHKKWLAGYAESAHTCSQCPAKHYNLCPPKEEDRARFSKPCIKALIQWAELVTKQDAERTYPLPWEVDE